MTMTHMNVITLSEEKFIRSCLQIPMAPYFWKQPESTMVYLPNGQNYFSSIYLFEHNIVEVLPLSRETSPNENEN